MRPLHLLAFAALLAGCEAPAPKVAASPLAGATIALESCRVGTIGAKTMCGKLPVPENREAPEVRTIDLNIAVVLATGRDRAPDPVVWLAGGPGQGATEAFPPVLARYDELLRGRDFLLVDQRGTGSSHPLDCEESDDLKEALEAKFDRAKLRECLEKLDADPKQYTTAAAVEDLEAVRKALGYEQLNLIGGSYGTRMALEYARAYPQHVRTMVIDGVAPPQMALPESFSVDGQAALSATFEACAADPACAQAFPDPAGDLRAIIEDVRAAPKTVTVDHPRTGERLTFALTERAFVMGVRGLLYSPDLTRLLPLTLHAARGGNFGPFVAQAALFADSVGSTMSEGLTLSVACTEDLPRLDRAKVERESAESFLGMHAVDAMVEPCAMWPKGVAHPDNGTAVSGAMPTLVLSGTLDPVTPPRWGELAAQTLSNSTHVVVPDAGHGTLSLSCVPDLVTEFVASAAVAAVDGTCVQDHRRPSFFIDHAGPAH